MSNQSKNPNKQKQLKVSSRHQQRQLNYISVPEIRLMGKWLKQLGFHSGQSVTIIHKQNKILIVANPKNTSYAKN
jgi:toxic protein SymE